MNQKYIHATNISHMRLWSRGYRISANDRHADIALWAFLRRKYRLVSTASFFYRKRTAVVLRRRPVRHMQHAQGSTDGDARRSTYEPGELLNAAACCPTLLTYITAAHANNANQRQAHAHMHKNKAEQQENIQQLRGAVLGRELLHSHQHSR